MTKKQSFLERLTGSRDVSDDTRAGRQSISNEPIRLSHRKKQDVTDDVERPAAASEEDDATEEIAEAAFDDEYDNDDTGLEEAELAIDMFETGNEIIIQAMIAGVTPENLHISIASERVTLRGVRIPSEGIADGQFHTKELYWGPFTREIALPYEVDTDGAEAVEKYGLLIIRLPRIDKRRTAELKVRSI